LEPLVLQMKDTMTDPVAYLIIPSEATILPSHVGEAHLRRERPLDLVDNLDNTIRQRTLGV